VQPVLQVENKLLLFFLTHGGVTMQINQGGRGRGRYLVTCKDSEVLVEFIEQSSDDASLSLLDTLGPIENPHTALFDMPHETAASLSREFKHQGDLRIEPDLPAKVFSGWKQ
jgi:hypothetical protein